MKYAMSDLHGHFTEFMQMLELINFSENDVLYILGDIFDRGTENLAIYEYIKDKPNIKCIKGNHEALLLDFYHANKDSFSDATSFHARLCYQAWNINGGESTLREILSHDEKYQKELVNWLDSLPFYIIDENNLFTHSMISYRFTDIDKELKRAIKSRDILWNRDFVQYNQSLYTNIHGHTPTGYLSEYLGEPESDNIVRYAEKYIDIDCGLAYGRQLGCLCIDDNKEYYVRCQ